MLGEKKKTGANASVEARPNTSIEKGLSSKRIEDPEKNKEPSSTGKRSMMEFLHKKACKKIN